jgi:hypothetical protein
MEATFAVNETLKKSVVNTYGLQIL